MIGENMSVVLGFATSKFGIVASDGRFIGSNGKIIDENFDKTIKFNDNVIAGFAGYSKPCIQMIIELQNLYPLTDMCLEQILETISCRLPQIVDNKSATFLLIGKNMHGKIQLSGIGTRTNYIPINKVPTSNSQDYISIAPPGIDVDSIFINTLLEFQPDIQKGIDHTILRVSQLSDYVNNTRFQKDFFL